MKPIVTTITILMAGLTAGVLSNMVTAYELTRDIERLSADLRRTTALIEQDLHELDLRTHELAQQTVTSDLVVPLNPEDPCVDELWRGR